MSHRKMLGGMAAVTAVLALGIPGLTQIGRNPAPADTLAYVKIDNTGDGVVDIAYRWES